MFVEAVQRGEKSGMFRSGGEKPDVTGTPVPRFDLLELRGIRFHVRPVFARVPLPVRILRHYCALWSQTAHERSGTAA